MEKMLANILVSIRNDVKAYMDNLSKADQMTANMLLATVFTRVDIVLCGEGIGVKNDPKPEVNPEKGNIPTPRQLPEPVVDKTKKPRIDYKDLELRVAAFVTTKLEVCQSDIQRQFNLASMQVQRVVNGMQTAGIIDVRTDGVKKLITMNHKRFRTDSEIKERV